VNIVENPSTRALELARDRGGFIRSKEAKAAGIHSRTISKLMDEGKLRQLSRGIYRLKSANDLSNPDLVTMALAVPDAVVCLISALAFHKITTQIPHRVSIALPKKNRSPRLSFPQLEVHRFGLKSYDDGIETHKIDGISVKVYCIEKTVVDCFKFRNKIGMDVMIECLKMFGKRKGIRVNEVLKYARTCRVEKQITPYLEVILHR
jgi:predicted transcriptional regulator of viral defense system